MTIINYNLKYSCFAQVTIINNFLSYLLRISPEFLTDQNRLYHSSHKREPGWGISFSDFWPYFILIAILAPRIMWLKI